MMASLCVLDFEASSIDGWPIEVGVSQTVGSTVQTWSLLIRPAPNWSDVEWSAAAQRVHGICRRQLDLALDAGEVVRQLMQHIGGRLVLSDAPNYDGRWLKRLFSATGRTDFPALHDFHAAINDIFMDNPEALDWAYEYLRRHPAPHRAGPDAERLLRALLRAANTRL